MANLREIPIIKNELAYEFINSQSIANAIQNKHVDVLPADEMLYDNIFPYFYTPDKTKETKTYITIESYPLTIKDKIIKKLAIDIAVFCHKSIMHYNGMTRVDFLRAEIDSLINGKTNLGID